MRPLLHIFFFVLLLQDAFSLSNGSLDINTPFIGNRKKEDANTNCAAGYNLSKGFFNKASCFFQNIFSKKLVEQAEQEVLDFKNKEVEKLKKKLTKVVRTESGKLKEKTDEQFNYWDKFLEKTANEQIYKIDKFSKDQIDLIKNKGEHLLSTNIFSFSQNEKEKNQKDKNLDEGKQGEKKTETKNSRFWPFTSSPNLNEKGIKEEYPIKEERHSFLSFFKTEEKGKNSTETQETQEKKKQASSPYWWFTNKSDENIKTNELPNKPITEESNKSPKNSFFDFFRNNKTDDATVEIKEENEEQTQRSWYNIFSKESIGEKADKHETSSSAKQGKEHVSWWSKKFGKGAEKIEEAEKQKQPEEIIEHPQEEKHTEHWWNLVKILPKGDPQNEKENDADMRQRKDMENYKQTHESDSLFNLWGYGSHKDIVKPEEDENIKNTNTKTEPIAYEEKDRGEDSNIFDLANHGNTYGINDDVQEKEEEKKEKETEMDMDMDMEVDEEKDIKMDVEEKPKEGITSLFNFNNNNLSDETEKEYNEKEIVTTPNKNENLNFFEKIYNFNIDDVQDERFLSLLSSKHEGESNINCHPLIVFKVCVHKCYKELSSELNKEERDGTVTVQNITANAGLTNNDYKHLEKCILKCKKMSFDSAHGGCIQANGKLLNKKENYKEYLEEMERYNLHLTDDPTIFSDFSLEDKYVERKKKKGVKSAKNSNPAKGNVLQNNLKGSAKGKPSNYTHNIWNIAKEELNLQMFNRNNEKSPIFFQKQSNKTNKTNESNSKVQNTAAHTNINENNKKGFFEKSTKFFNTFKKKEKGDKEIRQTEETGSPNEYEKIEFLNNDAYTISDDVIHNEIYATSSSYMSTIFFLILIVLSVCIYFSVFTSIISQFFSACTDEITSFLRGSYKASLVNITAPDSHTEYFLPKNEKGDNYSNTNVDMKKNSFYVAANGTSLMKKGNAFNANGYNSQQLPQHEQV